MDNLNAWWSVLVTLLGIAAGAGAGRYALAALGARIEALTAQVTAMTALLGTLGTNVAVQEQKLTAHEAQDALRFQMIEHRLDTIDAHIQRLPCRELRCEADR